MPTLSAHTVNHRLVGIGAACAATALGLAYMASADAPAVYLAVNSLSLIMGLAIFFLAAPSDIVLRGPVVLAITLGGVLLATAFFGVSADGASRWIRIAGVSLQISLIVLPALVITFARSTTPATMTGIVLAAAALALQPDRAMAGVLAAGLAVLALFRRDRRVIIPLVVAVGGFAITLLRPDSLPAVPFVDQVLYSAFDVHPLAGASVLGGVLLLLVPALVGMRIDPENREIHAVFGTLWLGVIVAAAVGNYPTPVVGYGGSAILGYMLSLSFVSPLEQRAAVRLGNAGVPARRNSAEPDLRVGALHG